MFESAVAPEAPKGRRAAVLSMSTALQGVMLAAAILAPMAHVSALPPVKLAPRPPAPRLAHVKLAPVDESVKRAAMAAGAQTHVVRPRPIEAPTRVPGKPAARIFDEVATMPGFTGADAVRGSQTGVPDAAFLGQPVAAPPSPAPKPVAAAPAAPAAPQRLIVGGHVRPPRLIREVRPVYPPLARQARIQGVVKLNAVLSREGAVQSLRLVSGHPLLAPAALDAVRQWLYEPTLLNGQAVEVILAVDVNFRLSNQIE